MELNYVISTLIGTNNFRYLVLIVSPKKQITSLYSYMNQSVSKAQTLKTAEILESKKKYSSLPNETEAQVQFCSVLMHI